MLFKVIYCLNYHFVIISTNSEELSGFDKHAVFPVELTGVDQNGVF